MAADFELTPMGYRVGDRVLVLTDDPAEADRVREALTRRAECDALREEVARLSARWQQAGEERDALRRELNALLDQRADQKAAGALEIAKPWAEAINTLRDELWLSYDRVSADDLVERYARIERRSVERELADPSP